MSIQIYIYIHIYTYQQYVYIDRYKEPATTCLSTIWTLELSPKAFFNPTRVKDFQIVTLYEIICRFPIQLYSLNWFSSQARYTSDLQGKKPVIVMTTPEIHHHRALSNALPRLSWQKKCSPPTKRMGFRSHQKAIHQMLENPLATYHTRCFAYLDRGTSSAWECLLVMLEKAGGENHLGCIVSRLLNEINQPSVVVRISTINSKHTQPSNATGRYVIKSLQ